MSSSKQYLGDGLYAEFDGDQITIYTDRMEGRHYVVLGSDEAESFLKFLERCYRVKISVLKLPEKREDEHG